MSGSLLSTLALGFVLGLRHALDADHLVAVSTLVGSSAPGGTRSLWRSSAQGAIWGAGHTASLFVAAVLVILLRLTISERMALTLELGVGVMLMVLGLDLVWRVARGEVTLHAHRHQHGEGEHAHLHVHAPALAREADGAHHVSVRRPFVVGLVHGLAGSAALMLFVLSTIASPWLGLLYVLVFGVGTVLGMLVMSTLVGLPFVLAERLARGLLGRIQLAAGIGSFGFGAFYAWEVAVRGGLAEMLTR